MAQKAFEAADALERNARVQREAIDELLSTRDAFHARLAETLSNLPQGEIIEAPSVPSVLPDPALEQAAATEETRESRQQARLRKRLARRRSRAVKQHSRKVKALWREARRLEEQLAKISDAAPAETQGEEPRPGTSLRAKLRHDPSRIQTKDAREDQITIGYTDKGQKIQISGIEEMEGEERLEDAPWETRHEE
jgi:hypothetical protein